MASRLTCFFLAVVGTLLFAMSEALPSPHWGHVHGHDNGSYINYTTITGYFLQDDPNTDASTFNYSIVNLGLINRTYETDREHGPQKTQWERFAYFVRHLNRKAPRNVDYKVLILGRHGQGFHNVAESYYGTDAWNCFWARQDGNGTSTWADAKLTAPGVEQANVAHRFWANGLQKAGLPAPDGYYSSPLTRCLETARITYEKLDLPRSKPFDPIVKEKLREAIGRHTCDRRSSKSYIRANYPEFRIEKRFTENDTLWDPVLRETDSAQTQRLKELLDDVFSTDDGTFLAFSSHSGAIGALLRAIKHRPFSLQTGGVIPVLVKAETIGGNAPTTTILGPTPGTTCSSNPTKTA